MKKQTYTKAVLISALLLVPLTSSAIQYIKGKSKISAEDFNNCSTRIFRKEGQDELSPENRRQAVKDALVGKTINDLGALKTHLASNPDDCSYGSDKESF